MEPLSSIPYSARFSRSCTTLLLFLTIGFPAACAAGPGCLAEAGEETVRVTIGSIGWHTGMVVPLAEVGEHLPETTALPRGKFLEIGWGDRRYYMAEDPSVWTLLRAGLIPTSSVLQVNTFDREPEIHFGRDQVVHLPLKRRAFERLLKYIDESFDRRNNQALAQPLGTGHEPQSLFYAAEGKFWLFNTCNTWAAKGLRKAGCKLSRPLPITSRGLLHDVRRLNGSD